MSHSPCHFRRPAAFSLIDLLAVGAIVGVFLVIAIPGTFRARELSRRGLCAINLRTIGVQARNYADAHAESWMLPPFKAGAIDNEGIEYRDQNGRVGDAPGAYEPGEVGFDRPFQSTSESLINPDGGSTALSVTRAFWMLVRSGDLAVDRFICPSTLERPDPTEIVDLYYDFTSYNHVSYGYLVPFGPPETRPRTGADPRKVFAADKGPFYLGLTQRPDWEDSRDEPLTTESSPLDWKKWYNSANHGGPFNGEGQNCLFADGGVEFFRTPLAGIDNDNIYTVMTGNWDLAGFNRIHGNIPHDLSQPPYPGQDAFCSGAGCFSSTDSLIYP